MLQRKNWRVKNNDTTQNNKTKLIFYGGIGEIGGNKILLDDNGTKIFLDFGMSFSQRKKYFTDPYLSPRNKEDLIEVGLLPDIKELYEANMAHSKELSPEDWTDLGRMIDEGLIEARDAEGNIINILKQNNKLIDGILITHAHEDHFKYMGFVDGAKIYCSSETAKLIYGVRECSKTNFETDIKNVEIIPKDDSFKIKNLLITPIEVNHSAHGSAAYIIETSIGSIIYTGDFRLGDSTRNFIEVAKKVKPKILICEGTNVGNQKKGLKTELEVIDKIRNVIENNNGLTIVDFSFKNIERFFNIYKLSLEKNKNLIISTKLYYILSKLFSMDINKFSHKFIKEDIFRNMRIYFRKKERYDLWEKSIIQNYELNKNNKISEISKMDNKIQRESIIAFSFYDLKSLIDIKPKNAIYIKSACEPFNEEMEIEENILNNWLDKYEIKREEAHASGHIAFDELKEVIKEINPEYVIPVHTENPDLFKKEIQKLGFKVILPIPEENCLEDIEENSREKDNQLNFYKEVITILLTLEREVIKNEHDI